MTTTVGSSPGRRVASRCSESGPEQRDAARPEPHPSSDTTENAVQANITAAGHR
ncbi:hypothetical protein [Micromonospora sp. NPDC050276]|uniref:hypothetical protein n=1 Tax=Micromonospora sp. NPDC050276 TaxID=3364278 RepID=UPI0037A5F424